MTRPITRPYPMPGSTWYCVTARYPTDAMGSAAYQRVMRRMPRGDLGIYRHGLPGEGGTNVSSVSMNRAEILRVARLLSDGEDLKLDTTLVEAMVLRRAQVVVDAAQADALAGRMKIKHAKPGAFLFPDGTMHEPGPGRG